MSTRSLVDVYRANGQSLPMLLKFNRFPILETTGLCYRDPGRAARWPSFRKPNDFNTLRVLSQNSTLSRTPSVKCSCRISELARPMRKRSVELKSSWLVAGLSSASTSSPARYNIRPFTECHDTSICNSVLLFNERKLTGNNHVFVWSLKFH